MPKIPQNLKLQSQKLIEIPHNPYSKHCSLPKTSHWQLFEFERIEEISFSRWSEHVNIHSEKPEFEEE